MKISEIFPKIPEVFISFGKKYEERKEQLDYAWAIYDALENNEILLIEAETGVGKTLGYLLPAILYAKKYNKRVVITTYTKVLQNQLLNSDILLAKKILPFDFSYSCAYGKENYLCKKRVKNIFNYQLFEQPDEKEKLLTVSQIFNEKKGLLIDYSEILPSAFKEKITHSPDACLGENCHYYEECFYQKAKKEWENTDILIINHALFFSNLRYQFLPEYQAVIFDEAHALEEVCANTFGFSISENQLKNLIFRLYNPKAKTGLLKILNLASKQLSFYQKEIFHFLNSLEDYFSKLKNFLGGEQKKRVKEDLPLSPLFLIPLERICDQLKKDAEKVNNKELKSEFLAWLKETQEKKKNVEDFYQEKDNTVFWVEIVDNSISLNASLIDVKTIMGEYLFDKKIPLIFTSATLRVKGDFSFFASRLGIKKYDQKYFTSPFDYSSQALVYIEKNIPLPTEEEIFYEKSAKLINDIINHAKGKTLVLFTSFKALKKVYELCDKTKYPIFFQDENSSPPYLLAEFQKNLNACLFATGSFWQGIDVPGESLSCLIITRLPFDVPDEPRVEGIKEKLLKENLDPFWHYQLPNAVLKFRQGFGRLIRSKDDYGVVVILDKRIKIKSYGKYFLLSLPKTVPITDNINILIKFFQRWQHRDF